ncbi:MAG: ATP-binding protein [Deltaproteobacteria bacterium]|nr:ATP-binding protein [Deltaproteobacteria bacterium]
MTPVLVRFIGSDGAARLARLRASCDHELELVCSGQLPHILIVSSGVSDWPERVAAARELHPALRVILETDSLEAARVAINEVGIDQLVLTGDERALAEAITVLGSRPKRAQLAIERLIQGRTAVLEQVKQQWEQSFDALADPLALLDEDFRIVRVNRAYADELGYDITAVPGQLCHQLWQARAGFPSTNDGPCRSCPMPIARNSAANASAVMTDARRRRWSVSCYPTLGPGDESHVLCHYRNISREAKRLDQLARADKLSAVGKLAGAVAHELNSPMTSIIVFAEALAKKTDADSPLHEHAREINASALRCRRLIQGLLRFARRSRPENREAVVLQQVLADVKPLVEHRLNMGGVRLVYDIPDSIPAVLAHVADVEHVLIDLITNATEACARGATITVSAKVAGDEPAVEITVADTGRGMSADQLSRAFDPFYSTREGELAAGLGLTICESIISELDGSIDLVSELNVGTKAIVRLPTA